MEAEREGDKNIVTGVELPAVIKSEEARGEVEKNAELEEKRKEWVIDVKRPSSSSSSASNGRIGGEKECRICHLSREEEEEEENHNLIELGCACKGELGVSHLSCAQTWFKLKGNRYLFYLSSLYARFCNDLELETNQLLKICKEKSLQGPKFLKF
ncbi:hypothetical protein LguiA_022395 [Lonicera macranthoides]